MTAMAHWPTRRMCCASAAGRCLPGVVPHSLSLRGGTASSNPASSSKESANFLFRVAPPGTGENAGAPTRGSLSSPPGGWSGTASCELRAVGQSPSNSRSSKPPTPIGTDTALVCPQLEPSRGCTRFQQPRRLWRLVRLPTARRSELLPIWTQQSARRRSRPKSPRRWWR